MGQIHPKDGAEGHRVREPHRQMNYPCWQLSYTLHRFGGGNHPNCRRTVLRRFYYANMLQMRKNIPKSCIH